MAKKVAAKKSSTKKAAPKAAAKKAKAPAANKRMPNAGFMKPMTVSADLAAVIGDKPMPRTEVTKKLWEYIKKNKLQDPKKKTNINADAKLRVIFKKATVSMFEMTKLVSAHLK
jgi:upstream activation factor subunit UAF30